MWAFELKIYKIVSKEHVKIEKNNKDYWMKIDRVKVIHHKIPTFIYQKL